MGDTGFLELVIRSIVSLGVVLAIIAAAYVVAKRRGGVTRPSRMSGRALVAGRSRQQTRRDPVALETLGRIGLSRGSVAMAVRFGDNVVLLGLAEGAPITVLHEMPAERWDELTTAEAPAANPVATPITTDILGNEIPAAQRPTFVEALREATVRRA